MLFFCRLVFLLPFCQQLQDLDSVCGSAFAYLIAAAPQIQCRIASQIFTDAAHPHQILIGGVQRRGIIPTLKIGDQLAAGEGGNGLVGLLDGDLSLVFTVTEIE